MNHARLAKNRSVISGKTVIGIDPAKDRHRAAVVDAHGNQIGSSFSFQTNHTGYHHKLWQGVAKVIEETSPETIVFAVETACNLWETIAFYLHSHGYTVVLVSPLSTRHSRPVMSLEFSRTDPKDAYLIATIAQRGAFQLYESFTPESNAMHSLGITYDKLRKALAQNRARVRALLDRFFPEFPKIMTPSTNSAVYLLKKYLYPDEFLAMDIDSEEKVIEKISRKQYGRKTLEMLQEAAKTTVGVKRQADERIADRIALESYLAMIETAEEHMEQVLNELISRAKKRPEFERLTSLSGVGNQLAALFLAEVRELSRYTHYKHIEKLAGYNLRLHDSGRFSGVRHISSLGNHRLRWILFKMTEESSKRVPEIRLKYLRRQIKRRGHTKNVVAVVSKLLQLIMAMEKEQRPYEVRDTVVKELQKLEEQYEKLKKNKRSKKTKHVA